MDNSVFLGKKQLSKRTGQHLFFLFLIGIITEVSAACGHSIFTKSSDDTLTVMTYNIHHGRGTNGNINLDRIASVINQSNADIVALQEVDIKTERSGSVDILSVLTDKTDLKHKVFGMNLEFDNGEYGNAILSRYPIENHQNYHFENLSGEQRGVLTAVININAINMLFINTHLDYRERDDSERVLYAKAIRDLMITQNKKQPIILAGDLNDEPESKTYHIIQSFLCDSWLQAGFGDGFTIPVSRPDRRIDYIFYSGPIEPLEAKVVQSSASDHLPVVVKFLYSND